MKLIASLTFLLALAGAALAAGTDDQYLEIYTQILLADAAVDGGHSDVAAIQYRNAQTALQKLHEDHPAWNPSVVAYRLVDLQDKLKPLAKYLPAAPATNAAPTSTNALPQQKIAQMQAQLDELSAANTQLQMRLKEALSIQPAADNPHENAKAQAKILLLQKELDLANASSAQPKAAASDTNAPAPPPMAAPDESAQLRARLAVLEAAAVPYTPEELAVLNAAPSTAPAAPPAATEPSKHTVHGIKDLPPGTGALMADAQQAAMQHDYEGAEKKYLEVLRQDPDNVYVLSNLGNAQYALGHLEDCEKNVSHAQALDPEDPGALYLLGILRYRQQRLDEALSALTRSAAINGTNSSTQNYLGCVLADKGLRGPAETAFRKALTTDPDYADAHYNLAFVYATDKPPSMSLAQWHYRKSLDLGHPKNDAMEKLIAEAK